MTRREADRQVPPRSARLPLGPMRLLQHAHRHCCSHRHHWQDECLLCSNDDIQRWRDRDDSVVGDEDVAHVRTGRRRECQRRLGQGWRGWSRRSRCESWCPRGRRRCADSQLEAHLDKYLRAISSFRDDIRKLAIAGGSSKDILTLCDRFRDQDLVNLGVQLDDGQGAGKLGERRPDKTS